MMIAQLRQILRALERPAGIDSDPGCLPLGIETIDAALGGGLARGALHEIAAAGEAHLAAAAGFALAVSSRATRKSTVWIAEDMALAESGAPYGPGLETFGLSPERLLTVAAARSAICCGRWRKRCAAAPSPPRSANCVTARSTAWRCGGCRSPQRKAAR